MRFGKKFIGFCGYFAISRKYFFEYQLLAPIRSLTDGLTFLKFNINWDRYKDNHKPSFEITLNILNIYNQVKIYKNE
jgi:hypothetical protein